MKTVRFVLVLLLTSLLPHTISLAQQKSGQPSSQPDKATPAPLLDDDPVSVLVPKKPRDEHDQNRLTAATMFAHGRLLFQQKKLPQALARYERAWQYDATSNTILTEIVPLALKLKRNDEAVRYAILAAENDHSDVERMRRIASLLRQQRQFPRALKIYEIIDQLQTAKELDFQAISLKLELGKLYFLTNQPGAAAKALVHVQKALQNPKQFGLSDKQKQQLEGKNGATYLVIAESLLLDGQAKNAQAMYRESHRVAPDEPLLAFRIARCLEKQKQPENALEQLELFFAKKTADQGIAPYLLLERLIQQQSQDEAVRAKRYLEKLQSLHQADPENQPLSYQLAQTQAVQKNYQAAETLFRMLLSEKPTADAHRGLITILVTQLAKVIADQPKTEPLKWSDEQQEVWTKLTSQLASLVGSSGSLDPLRDKLTKQIFDNQEFVSQLLIQFRTQLNLEVAADPAQDKPAEVDPDGEEKADIKSLAIAAALVAVHAQQWKDADTFFAKALEESGEKPVPVYEVWGLQMLMAEQFERSAEVFQQAIDHPSLSNKRSFYFLLAGAAEMAHQTDKALVAARKAVEMSPKLPRIHSRVPWVYYHAQQYAEAEKHYQALITKFDSEYSSSDTRDVLRQARLTLSNLCVLQDRNAEAEEWLAKVLDEFPEDIGALNDLGYLWADQNKHLDRALEMIQTAVTAEPENVAYRDSLGWAYYRLGNYQQAVQELEKAANDPNPDSVILDHLGDAYLKVGKIKEARETWQRAIKALDENAKESTRNKIQEKLKSQ